jgi:hypothetical protein
VASYSVNRKAVEHARELIESRQYVLRSEWGDVQPTAADENAYLERHTWEEYGAWHLGLTEGAAEESHRDSSIGVSIATPRRNSRASSMSDRDGMEVIAVSLEP